MTGGSRRTLGELVRYGVVGAVSNLVLFAGFLLLVRVGVRAQLALTILYAVGVAQTFVFNKRWTFGDAGRTSPALRRYVVLHLSCWGLNLVLLSLLVDHLGWPVAWVQGAATFLIAALLFLGQKFWVFNARFAAPQPSSASGG